MSSKQILSALKLIIYIIVLSYTIDKIIYYSLSELGQHVYTGQSIGKLNQFLSVKDNMDLIIVGSSRANHHIDPDKLSSKGFNMGMDGQFIAYYTMIIKLLPPQKKQTVLLHLDPDNLFSSTYSGDDLATFQIKYHQNHLIKKVMDDSGKINLLNRFFWSIDYNGKVIGILKNYFKPKYDHKKYNGYDPLVLDKTQKAMRDISLKSLSKNKSCPTQWKKNKTFVKNLQELSLFCNENNKKLIVITSPIYRDPCEEDNGRLKKLMTELKITYIDYTNFFNSRDSANFWKDNLHLSKVGATIFTEELAKDLFLPYDN